MQSSKRIDLPVVTQDQAADHFNVELKEGQTIYAEITDGRTFYFLDGGEGEIRELGEDVSDTLVIPFLTLQPHARQEIVELTTNTQARAASFFNVELRENQRIYLCIQESDAHYMLDDGVGGISVLGEETQGLYITRVTDEEIANGGNPILSINNPVNPQVQNPTEDTGIDVEKTLSFKMAQELGLEMQ